MKKKIELSSIRIGEGGLFIDTREYSFQSTERALYAYNEACHLIDQFTPYEPEYFIKLIGNTIRVPIWFPYIPIK